MSAPEKVELFHLLFLRHLGEKLDKNLYALKGGCNLRFYFKSIRYSEDMDLDVRTVAVGTLQAKVQKILESPGFRQNLMARELEIRELTAPKQTQTVQRWKLALKSIDSDVLLRTKIEFSRRGIEVPISFEAIDPDLIRTHKLTPILASHYTKESAYLQKVEALVRRTETQARDVFDLNVLEDMKARPDRLPAELLDEVKKAQETAKSIGYADYKSQVFAYLHPSYQEHYGTEKAWDEMVTKVVHGLGTYL